MMASFGVEENGWDREEKIRVKLFGG